jgi:integrase
MKKRADGRWLRVITINGKKNYFYSDADTESKAEKDIRRQIMAFECRIENGIPFAEIADDWRTRHFPSLNKSSLRGYAPAVNDAIAYFGEKPAREITPKDVTVYLAELSKQGYAQKTVNNKKLVLNLIMRYAVSVGEISTNPVGDAIAPKKLPKKKRRSLTSEEMKIVKEHRHDSWMAYFAYFLMHTGLRRGEALALTYGDYNKTKKAIHVTKSTEYVGNNATVKDSPKTDAGVRYVPVTDEIGAFLSKGNPKEFTFAWNGKIPPNHVMRDEWEEWRKSVGLPNDITPHVMRHTYATILYDAGVDVKAAQSILGHANIATTMDIYTHLSEERSTDAADKIRRFLG